MDVGVPELLLEVIRQADHLVIAQVGKSCHERILVRRAPVHAIEDDQQQIVRPLRAQRAVVHQGWKIAILRAGSRHAVATGAIGAV
jgi:hypothetical protein